MNSDFLTISRPRHSINGVAAGQRRNCCWQCRRTAAAAEDRGALSRSNSSICDVTNPYIHYYEYNIDIKNPDGCKFLQLIKSKHVFIDRTVKHVASKTCSTVAVLDTHLASAS